VLDITASLLLRDARERAALSQRQLAERANTTQAVISRIEADEASPSLATLSRLIQAAGFELRVELVTRTPLDPVVDAYKPGVDRTLLVMQLRKSPQQRFRDLLAARKFTLRVREAGRRARHAKSART